MTHLPRRVVSIGTVMLLLPTLIVLTPIVLIIGTITDLAMRRTSLPTIRLWLFAIVFVAHEWCVIPYAGWLWIRGGFGRRLDRTQHREIQGRWIASLLRWARRLLSVRVDWPRPEAFPPGRVVILSRHASMIDAVLPAHFVVRALHRHVHYVLKRELRWLPSLDIYGHRLGNHFVDRGGRTETEVAAITAMLADAEPDSGLVIFPEGTYASPAQRQRVLESLRRRGDESLLEYARSLDHLLPPKPAGALALLEGADHVVILGHVGLEGVAQLSGLRRHLPATRPVVTHTWTFAIADLPAAPDERTAWLNDRWRELDRWVHAEQAQRHPDQSADGTDPEPGPRSDGPVSV